jgi:hypothetical protein
MFRIAHFLLLLALHHHCHQTTKDRTASLQGGCSRCSSRRRRSLWVRRSDANWNKVAEDANFSASLPTPANISHAHWILDRKWIRFLKSTQ